MKKADSLAVGALSVVTGVLFLTLKGKVIEIVMTVLGAALILLGLLDLLKKKDRVSGIIKAVTGVVILVAGWLIVSFALYVFAAFLLVVGLLELVRLLRGKDRGRDTVSTLILYLNPVAAILAAGLLFFHRDGAVNWVFTVAGILLIVEGVLTIVSGYEKEQK